MRRKLLTIFIILLILPAFTGCANKSDASKLLSDAKQDLRAKDIKGAETKLLKAYDIDKTNAEVVMILAQIKFYFKDNAKAYSYLEQGLKDVTGQEELGNLYAVYSDMLMRDGKTDKAEKMIDMALKKFPNNQGLQSIKSRLAIAPGKPAPDFTGTNIRNGRKVSLSKLYGKVVLIDFWASWCGPCRRSIPHLLDINKKYKNKKFFMIGINLDQKKSDAMKMIRDKKMNFTILFGYQHNQQISAKYMVRGIPSTILIDKKGIIRYNGHPSGLKAEEVAKYL